MRISSWCVLIVWTAAFPHAPVHDGLAARAQAPPSTQSQDKTRQGTSRVKPEDLPVDIDRIQRALSRTPMLRFDESQRPVFRVQIFGEKPTIDDILGPDWEKGPVPYGGMTHQEFLKMVTPTDVQGYAAFSNEEGITVAATSFLLQWTLQKAIQKYRETTDERERAAARREVLEALEALEKARTRAGMRDK